MNKINTFKTISLCAAALALVACSTVTKSPVTVSPEQLRRVQTGVTKQQLYTILGNPLNISDKAGKQVWDYQVAVKDPNSSAASISCPVQIQWNEPTRLSATIEQVIWQNPAQCPPQLAPQIVTRDVVREVIKEVVREVVREVPVPVARVAASSMAMPEPKAQTVLQQQDSSVVVQFLSARSDVDAMLPESKVRKLMVWNWIS